MEKNKKAENCNLILNILAKFWRRKLNSIQQIFIRHWLQAQHCSSWVLGTQEYISKDKVPVLTALSLVGKTIREKMLKSEMLNFKGIVHTFIWEHSLFLQVIFFPKRKCKGFMYLTQILPVVYYIILNKFSMKTVKCQLNPFSHKESLTRHRLYNYCFISLQYFKNC